MSYFLIRKDQEKLEPSGAFLRIIKVFMVFSLVMTVLGLSSEFLKSGEGLSLPLGNQELNLKQISFSSLSSINTEDYFVNSEFGLLLRSLIKGGTRLKLKEV
jgi:hypothetical protein